MKMADIVYTYENKVYLNLTNECPCRCKFCIRNNGDGAYGSDTLWLEREPTADEVLDKLLEYDISKYLLSSTSLIRVVALLSRYITFILYRPYLSLCKLLQYVIQSSYQPLCR